jgi:hypothetical protein
VRQALLIKYAISLARPKGSGNDSMALHDDEIATVKAHLETCPACFSRVEAYRRSYMSYQAATTEIVQGNFPPSGCVDETIPEDWQDRVKGFGRLTNRGRIAVLAAVFLLAAGLSTFLADHLTRPGYYKLASVHKDNFDQIVLYRERSSLLQAIFLFRSGSYEKAISALEACLATKEGYNMRPYLRLMQGLAYLKLAESSTYGLFPRFDINRVEAAIVTLQACVDEAAGSEMASIRASAYIYQAKAHLMSGNVARAQQALRSAMAASDELAEEAKQMLAKLKDGEQAI